MDKTAHSKTWILAIEKGGCLRFAGRLALQRAPRRGARGYRAPRIQAASSRSRGCASKHPGGYRDTVYRRSD
jgi:hypothetical protein